jgi:hypothetical protein
MLKWPRKQWPLLLPERRLFFGKLLALSTIAHMCIALLILFACYDNKQLHIDLTKTMPLDVSFQVMPFMKKSIVPVSSHTVSTSATGRIAAGISFNQTSPAQKQIKNSSKKNKTTKPKSLKKVIKPKEQKKSKKETVSEKNVESVKPKEKSKQEIKKQSVKEVKENKIVEPPVISSATRPEPINQNAQLTENVSVPSCKTSDVQDYAQPIMISRQDYEQLELYSHVQQEVQQAWKPPLGVSHDCSCTLCLVIDETGKVSSISVKESSGILAYDSAAQLALKEIIFPQQARGKEIMITFKQ